MVKERMWGILMFLLDELRLKPSQREKLLKIQGLKLKVKDVVRINDKEDIVLFF
jgi:hypothetical protein